MSRVALLVDDDGGFRATLARILEPRGFSTVAAASGEEADRRLESAEFDLFVVEGSLPDVDGVRWLEALRERGRGTAAKVVFVSALWRDAATVRRLTRELGVSLVVFKPVAASVLAGQLAPLLEGAAPPSSDGAVSRAQNAVAELRREYARELPGKVTDLERALRNARAEGPGGAAFESARSAAHRLCGTAGSYGFAAVGEAAGRVESALLGVAGAPDAAAGDRWDEVERALQGVEGAVKESGSDGSGAGDAGGAG